MRAGCVIWHDTHSSGEWNDIPKAYVVCEVFTAGFITEHSDGLVVIGSFTKEHSPNGSMCFGITHIPNGCIKSIRYFDGIELA